MIAYHNDPAIKEAILAKLRAHRLADEIVHGVYWADGKGCAVGCTIHGRDYFEYEHHFGIPRMLAGMEDCIFEGIENSLSKDWPEQFMSAIRPGADLSSVPWQLLYAILSDKRISPGVARAAVVQELEDCAAVALAMTSEEPPSIVRVREVNRRALTGMRRVQSESTIESLHSAMCVTSSVEYTLTSDTRATTYAMNAIRATVRAAVAEETDDTGHKFLSEEVYLRISCELLRLLGNAPMDASSTAFLSPEH